MPSTRALFAAATAVVVMSAAPAFAYDAIVSFGDSLSDVGNVFAATGGAEPNPPYYMGRFSNGPIWLEDVAGALRLPIAPSILGGNDFAFGGATTGYPATNSAAVPNLELQVDAYGVKTGGHADPNALYTFSIGANDLFAAIGDVIDAAIANPADIPAAEAEAFADAAGAASVVGQQGGALMTWGAKELLLFDVPDLSVTPDMRAAAAEIGGLFGSTAAADFSAFVKSLTATFDEDVLGALRTDAPKLAVVDLGTFAFLDQVVGDPTAYGFSNVTQPCFVPTNPDAPFTSGGTTCGDAAVQAGYLFWDGVHPTEAAGQLIADRALAAVPEPSTWAMLAAGFVALALAGGRGRRGRQSSIA